MCVLKGCGTSFEVIDTVKKARLNLTPERKGFIGERSYWYWIPFKFKSTHIVHTVLLVSFSFTYFVFYK